MPEKSYELSKYKQTGPTIFTDGFGNLCFYDPYNFRNRCLGYKSERHVGHGLQAEIGKRHPFDSIEQEVYLNLMRTQSVLAGEFSRLFRCHGLTESLYNTLRILRGAGEHGQTCGQVGSMLITRVPDVTRLMNRLVRDGLATRLRSVEDRRVVRVVITTNGHERLAMLDEEVLSLHRKQLGHVAVADLKILCKILEAARYRPIF